MWYILDDDKNPVACSIEESREFARDYSNKVVKQEQVGDYWVSTIFLGINHAFGRGAPLLFESMAFKEDETIGRDVDQERYYTYQEAEEGHEAMVDKWRNHGDH